MFRNSRCRASRSESRAGGSGIWRLIWNAPLPRARNADTPSEIPVGGVSKAPIDHGDYTNDSEYIRDLIRREQERSAAAAEGGRSNLPYK